jgi:hypothetical protein
MKENLHGGYELSLHGPGRDDGCGTAPSLDAISSLLSPADRLPATVWTVSARVDDLAPRQGSPLPAVASELPPPRCDERTGRRFRALAAAGNLRAGLRAWPGRDLCRLDPIGRNGRGDVRRLAGQRPMAIRQRLPACRLDGRVLRHDRRREAASRRRRAAAGPGCFPAGWRLANRGHLVLHGAQGHREPSHRTQRQAGACSKFLRFRNGVPCLPGPLYQAVPHLLPLFHGAIDVGMADGAMDDLLVLADTGRQQFRAAVPMRESEIFQFELGRIAADLKAARASLEVQAASHWRHALAGTLKDEAHFIQGTQTGIWVATTCVRVADACFTLAGGSAVYESSPLQRCLRDLHAAGQHAAIHQRHYVAAGKSALAQFRRRPEEPSQLAAE